MNISFEKIDNVNAKVTVTLEEADYKEKIAKTLKEIRQTRPEKGYRPGHVPMALIEKKYGKPVKYDVINREVSEALFNYIKEQDLNVLGNPVADKDESFDLDQTEFKFTFRLGLAPEMDTHVNKDLHVPYYTIKVSDEMVDRQDEMFTKRLGKQEPGETVEPNALVKGVITELNEDGTAKEGGVVVENGIVSPEYFKSDAQKELFVGKHVGDMVRFNPAETCEANPAEMASMLNIDKDDVENHKGDFNFEIKEIIVLRPAEHDQEYYDKIFGADKVHNEEEYKNALREMIAAQLKNDSDYRFRLDAKNDIMKAVGDVELPDAVLKDYLMQQNEALSAENIDNEYAALRSDLIWQLLRDRIAKQLDIKLEEADIRGLAGVIARQQLAQYGITNLPDDGLKYYVDNLLKDENHRRNIAEQALDLKLFNGIRASVTVDEKEVSIDDFNKLFTEQA